MTWQGGKTVKVVLHAGSDDEVTWVNGDHEETLQLKKGKSYTL